MSETLAGKVALVTGGGRGLGRAIALGLAAQGAKVAVVARSIDEIHETEGVIRQSGGTALALTADVSDSAQVGQLKQRVEADLGRVSIVINAAGVFGPIQLVKDSDARRWIETLMVNTVGPYLVCRAFVNDMIEMGWGRIVNVSSAAALHAPGPLNSAYGTSKVALNQFTRHLAAELAGTGVTVNVIHPGEIKTQMWATIRSESNAAGPLGEGLREWVRDVERNGGDDPSKALELVLKLLSDSAADVNGQFLWIDGGLQTPVASW